MVTLPAPPYSYETGKTSASVNWKVGKGNGRTIKGITIHHWGSSMNLDFDGIVNFLCSPRPSNPTSAHYVAQGKDQNGKVSRRVACIVDPEDIAYACGNWNGNLTTISIECRPNCSAEDLEVVAQLIARLRNQYGNLPLYPHSYWVSTECPGSNYRAQLAWLSNRANAILGGSSSTPAPTPTPTKVVNTMTMDDAKALFTGYAIVKDVYAKDPNTADRVAPSTLLEGTAADARAVKNSVAALTTQVTALSASVKALADAQGLSGDQLVAAVKAAADQALANLTVTLSSGK